MKLTDEQLATWERDGNIVVPDIFPPEAFVPALEAVERNGYDGMTYAEYQAKWDANPDELKEAYEKTSPMALLAGPFGGALHFPTGLDAVDKLLENEDYIEVACQLLATDEIRLGYGQIFVRDGLTDTRYSEQPWEGYHIDNATNSPLPPHPDWQRYGYLLSCAVLHDIDPDGAPMLLCRGSHRQLDALFGRHAGRAGGMGFPDLREFKELANQHLSQRKPVVLSSVPVIRFTPRNRLRTTKTAGMDGLSFPPCRQRRLVSNDPSGARLVIVGIPAFHNEHNAPCPSPARLASAGRCLLYRKIASTACPRLSRDGCDTVSGCDVSANVDSNNQMR